MIHSRAHAHMPYVRRPCQDAHAPFELEDLSRGFAQSSFVNITGVFSRVQGKPEPEGWLSWCWGMTMYQPLAEGTRSSVYIKVTGTPVKPPSSSLVLLYPTPIPAGSISSPKAPSTWTKLRSALALLSWQGDISALRHRSLALLLSL